MQFKISVLGAILAASSSVLAAPTTSPLSPDAAINAVIRLTTETKHDYYQLEGLMDQSVYNEKARSGLVSLIEAKTLYNAEFGLGGDAEGLVGFTSFSQKQEQELCDSITAFVTADISFLNRIVELKEEIYDDIGGVLESDRLDTNTLLEGLINYSPSCADDVTPEIEKLEKVEKEAVAAYGFSVDE